MSQDKPVLDRDEIMLFIDDLIVAHPIYTPHLRFLRDLALIGLERQGSGKWVPLEPTQSMLDAAIEGQSFPQDFGADYQGRALKHAAHIYRAMLTAAPSSDTSDHAKA